MEISSALAQARRDRTACIRAKVNSTSNAYPTFFGLTLLSNLYLLNIHASSSDFGSFPKRLSAFSIPSNETAIPTSFHA